MEAHLAVCDACRGEAKALCGVSRLLAEAPCLADRLPTGEQFVAGLPHREARASRFLMFPRGLVHGLAAGTVATIVVATSFLGRSSQPELSGGAVRAEQPPALVVIDDAESGRSVLLAPSAGGSPGAVVK